MLCSSYSRARSRDVLPQLGERVEARGLGRELVVELRQALALDLADGDLERRLLAGELLGVVVGERHLDGARLAREHADQLLLEPGNQPA